MTDRSQPNTSESIQQSMSSRETIAPSGLDSTPTGSGPFAALPAAFGRFEVRKLLGSGAMGTVYLAFDPELQKSDPALSGEVALKIPKFEAADEPILLERFWREAQATGAMDHPNICKLYEVGEINGTHYISMEYVAGRPLAEYIGADQPQRQVVAIVRKLAQGFAHAHGRGFIHRDLKPSNVMIDTNGQPKIMDFGLARRFGITGDIRLTQSNTIVGSPAYMSPEQARSENDTLTPASDIYSLGTLFFELLTGELPFKGPMAIVLGMIALQRVPKPSTVRKDVDPRLESLCLKMLEKKRDARPQSMTDVADTLTEWLKQDKSSKAGGSSDEITSPALAKEGLDGQVSSPTDAPALVPKKPVASPAPAKADFITEQQRRVTELLDKHQYREAIDLLEKMSNLRDAKFEKLVAWAKPKLKEVRATEQKLKEASAPICALAEQDLKRHDYTSAVQALEQVPPAYRSVELRDLLEQATDLRDECDHLQRDIEEAVRAGDTETLPALVRRLYKLKPNNKAIKQLAADVKQYGAKKVIALRKGQRRFLDPAGQTFEPQHIALYIVLLIGLFAGVTILTTNYLPSNPDKKSVPSPSPDSPKPDPHGGSTGGSGGDRKDDKPASLPQEVTSTATGMKFALIPAGTFTMGSPDTEVDRMPQEGPQHTVRISQPFYMGVYEVTQGEYQQVMLTNPSHFKSVAGQDTSRFPVEWVSWDDAVEFCKKLSEKDGVTYRLPTEAEWEYACRAGTTTPFHFGSAVNGDKANINGNFPYGTTTKGKYLERTTTVGSYSKNAFGLFDMHGNVWEWCEDVYDEKAYASRNETTTDPKVTSGSEYRVLRGACWGSDPKNARSALHNREPPDKRWVNTGFRVVRSVPRPLPDFVQPKPTPQSKPDPPQPIPPTPSPPQPNWNVLVPTEMNSSGGSTLTKLDDNSILVSGKNPDQDVYTITVAAPPLRVTGVRLEVLPHDSLPRKSPGRCSNGNFLLTEFEIHGPTGKLEIDTAQADYSQPFCEIARVHDNQTETGWAISAFYDGFNVGRTAVFRMVKPIETTPVTPLTIVLRHQNTQFLQHGIGRFRLSVTGMTDPFTEGDAKGAGPISPATAPPVTSKDDPKTAASSSVARLIIESKDVDYHSLKITTTGIESVANLYAIPEFVVNGKVWKPKEKPTLSFTDIPNFDSRKFILSRARVESLAFGFCGDARYRYSSESIELGMGHVPVGGASFKWEIVSDPRHLPFDQRQPEWIGTWDAKLFGYNKNRDGTPPNLASVETQAAVAQLPLADLYELHELNPNKSKKIAAILGKPFVAVAKRQFRVKAGRFQVRTIADDGVKVYIDDALVIDNWTAQSTTLKEKVVALSTGVRSIRVEYFDGAWPRALGVFIERVDSP